jgi:cytochrome c
MSAAKFPRLGTIGLGVALTAFALAACSKSASNQATDMATPAATDAQAVTNDATPAPALTAPDGAPAADNTATLDGTKLASYKGDPKKGQQDFMACQICHTLDRNLLGPHLHGVIGRRAGSVADFPYSDAMKHSGITWTPEKLFQFLEGPQHVVPGTRMSFPGDHDPQRRADIIAYLKASS